MSELSWKTRAETDLGVTLKNWQSLSGGDFAQSYMAIVDSAPAAAERENNGALQPATPVFIKTHTNPPPQHFSTEASGLQWLAQTGTVSVPTVIGVSDEVPYLAISWVEESRRRGGHDAGEQAFGRQLAALHQHACPAFGREDRRSTGSLGLPNEPHDHLGRILRNAAIVATGTHRCRSRCT